MTRSWTFTRILPCLPATLALIVAALTALLSVCIRPDRDSLLSRYHVEADRALASGDATTARVCALRLMQLDPGDPMNRERLALANAMGR